MFLLALHHDRIIDLLEVGSSVRNHPKVRASRLLIYRIHILLSWSLIVPSFSHIFILARFSRSLLVP